MIKRKEMKPKRKEFVSKYMQLTGYSKQYADSIWFTLGYKRDSNVSGSELAEQIINPTYEF